MLQRYFLAVTCLIALSGTDLNAGPGAPATLISRFVWEAEGVYFGGFSALELEADGRSFVALSDRGRITSGQIRRAADGRITGIEAAPLQHLKNTNDRPLAGLLADSEGLALALDGSLFLSFEGTHRVWHYASMDAVPTTLPEHADFKTMIPNGSLEALAIAPDGALYTLPERSGHLTSPFPVYRFQNGIWQQPFSLPRQDGFLPVGADFDDEGRLYLLERQWVGIRGFTSRVRRFTLTELEISAPETLFESRPGQYDNLEGLAVWRAPNGHIRLTMISDDNFNFFQVTEIIEYEVKE